MSSNKEIRVGGKSYQTIKDTAKRYDKDKEKPVVTTNLVDKQRRKLDNLMARIDKPINLPERAKEWKPSDPREFVRNVMGSSAGAGSGEFHVYRAIRKRTMQREEFLTKNKEESEVQKEFNKRVDENREKEDAKTAKKRLKRQKQKANKKKPKQETVEISEESDLEEETTKENESQPVIDSKTDEISHDSDENKESLSDDIEDGTKTIESAVNVSGDSNS